MYYDLFRALLSKHVQLNCIKFTKFKHWLTADIAKISYTWKDFIWLQESTRCIRTELVLNMVQTFRFYVKNILLFMLILNFKISTYVYDPCKHIFS